LENRYEGIWVFGFTGPECVVSMRFDTHFMEGYRASDPQSDIQEKNLSAVS